MGLICCVFMFHTRAIYVSCTPRKDLHSTCQKKDNGYLEKEPEQVTMCKLSIPTLNILGLLQVCYIRRYHFPSSSHGCLSYPSQRQVMENHHCVISRFFSPYDESADEVSYSVMED